MTEVTEVRAGVYEQERRLAERAPTLALVRREDGDRGDAVCAWLCCCRTSRPRAPRTWWCSPTRTGTCAPSQATCPALRRQWTPVRVLGVVAGMAPTPACARLRFLLTGDRARLRPAAAELEAQERERAKRREEKLLLRSQQRKVRTGVWRGALGGRAERVVASTAARPRLAPRLCVRAGGSAAAAGGRSRRPRDDVPEMTPAVTSCRCPALFSARVYDSCRAEGSRGARSARALAHNALASLSRRTAIAGIRTLARRTVALHPSQPSGAVSR